SEQGPGETVADVFQKEAKERGYELKLERPTKKVKRKVVEKTGIATPVGRQKAQQVSAHKEAISPSAAENSPVVETFEEVEVPLAGGLRDIFRDLLSGKLWKRFKDSGPLT